MTDLGERFEALDWVETPYQWPDIERRAQEEPAPVRSPGLHGPLLGLASAAAVLVFAIGFVAGGWIPGLSAALRWALGGASYPGPVTPEDVSVLATTVAGTAGASVLAAAGVASVWRWMRRAQMRSMTRGGAMQTMSETVEELTYEKVARTNRWLTFSVVVLLAAVVAFGAWLLVDNLVKSDVEALIDDYTTAWETNDPALLRSVVTDNYTFRDLREAQIHTLSSMATEIEAYHAFGFIIEDRGELIVNGTMVTEAQTVSFTTGTFEGFSVFEIEDGKISRHVLVFTPAS